jgi:Cys-tRNA(Pro) deacylase
MGRPRAVAPLPLAPVQVNTKALSKQLSLRSIAACAPDTAFGHTGYIVGGTSPFGTKTALRVCMERSIADLPTVMINGGGRGFLVQVDPSEIVRVLAPTLVDAAE